jgi:hypothetical protein
MGSWLLQAWARLDAQWFGHRCAHPEAFEMELLEAPIADVSVGGELPSPVDVVLDLTSSHDASLWPTAGVEVWHFQNESQLWLALVRALSRLQSTFEDPHYRALDGTVLTQHAAYGAMDRSSLFRNASNACWRRAGVVTHELAGPNQDSLPEARTDVLPVAHLPARAALFALGHAIGNMVRTQFEKHCLREDWFIAFREIGGDGPFHFLVPPEGHFYADPFVVDRNGKSYIFFEDYSYAARRAVIAVVEVREDGGCGQPQVALQEPYHLAYPYVFQEGGSFYLLPESKDNRTIQLYRCVEFPCTWRLDAVLLDGVSACDSTLLRSNGKWWLFTSGLGTCDPWFDGDSELHLFFSDSLRGPWHPHPANPVVSDVRHSRSAGNIFMREGKLVRPAQDCSERYGYAVTLNSIEELSVSRYCERTIGRILPGWAEGNRGTHTYCRSARIEVVDGRTAAWRFKTLPQKAQQKTMPPRWPLIEWDQTSE